MGYYTPLVFPGHVEWFLVILRKLALLIFEKIKTFLTHFLGCFRKMATKSNNVVVDELAQMATLLWHECQHYLPLYLYLSHLEKN